MLQSAGVIKVDRLEELLYVSAILLAAPLPAGRRVALVGIGGPLILAADACEAACSSPSRNCRRRPSAHSGQVLVPAAVAANPVDLTADGTAEMLQKALEIVVHDDAIDAVIVIVVETPAISAAASREAVAHVAQNAVKPVIICSVEVGTPAGTSGSADVAEVPSPSE